MQRNSNNAIIRDSIYTLGIILIVSILGVALCSVIMNILNIDYKYSPVFATVCTAIGSFAGAWFLSAKKKSRGYFWGFVVGIAVFAVITLVGLIVNKGAISTNTLFHFIIIMLLSLIGGVLGVNKGPKKYI